MQQPLLFSGLVCLILCSGCLGFVNDEDSETSLIVVLSQDRIVIETVYDQAELISSSTPTVDVDFSQTTSDVGIVTYGILTDDGRSFSIDATKGQNISIEFQHHGMYTITVYAIDSQDVQLQEVKTLIVEQIITWSELDTGSPESLFFETTPGNDGPSPSYFILNSTVSNPSPLLEIDGRDVDVEWAVINEDGQCLGHREIIENGDSFTWNTLHFTPVEMHEVDLTIHEGQDSVDVEHRIELRYTE
ncbi:MAG: hypothetical protein CMB25_06655 [Euryarchaeota archaeon]|nr:hypothetical protein [Euryarchaeota archaeon]|tara:strand:- start:24188 stop:24925 length:738 start_codon:yes stop_codon:yes gene_type:complete